MFRHSDQLVTNADVIVANARRRATDTWLANRDPAIRPRSASICGTRVTLVFPTTITRIRNVPEYAHDDGTSIHRGPTLLTSTGIGALSIRNVPVVPTSVAEE